MAIFEGKKSSNDITNNDKMSDDEVVASYVPRGTCSVMEREVTNVSSEKALYAVHFVNIAQCTVSRLA